MPTYAVNSEKFSTKEATMCATLFWASSTLFRFVSVSITMKNSTKLKILLTSIFCCCVGCIILNHYQYFELIAMLGSICLGLSCSAVYPLTLSLSTEYKIKFKREQMSNVLMAPCFSSLIVAGVTGKFMSFGMDKLFICLLVTSGALCLNAIWFFRIMEK